MFSRTNTLSTYIKSYPITFFIIIVHICTYSLILTPIIPNQLLFNKLIGINLNISEGEIWRLFTPIFIHFHFDHFFYNTLSLAIMGPFIENLIGIRRFSLLYFISGFTGNAATFLFLPLSYAHVGSSGAIVGLLGCFLFFAWQKKILISERNQIIYWIILVISVLMTIFETEVNIIAHLAGFTTGFLFGWIFSKGE